MFSEWRNYLSSYEPVGNMFQSRLTGVATQSWGLYNRNQYVATTGGIS